MNQLLGFDPLLFLGITNIKDEEKSIVSQKLLDRISQYLAIRIVELLSEEDLKSIDDDPQKLFSLAKEKIPEFDNKVKVFLEDFKKEFNNNLKQV
ncbi:MAG: hypothetical protein AAB583_03605 [Patescibacteria group bacterium]